MGDKLELQDRKNSDRSVVLSYNKPGRTKHYEISSGVYNLCLTLGVIVIFLTLLGCFFSYKFYNETKTFAAQKETEINEILSVIEEMPQDMIVDKNLEQKFIERVLALEEEIEPMRKLLKRNNTTRKNIGGRGFSASDITSDYFNSVEEDLQQIKKVLPSIPLGKPVEGSISSGFGYRKSPFSDSHKFHGGIDFRAASGDDVVATADGVVHETRNSPDYGKYIVIEHDMEFKTLYAHLSSIEVSEGDKVSWGDVIGKIGSTGRSTGPHLHYEIIKRGKRINPRKYVSPR